MCVCVCVYSRFMNEDGTLQEAPKAFLSAVYYFYGMCYATQVCVHVVVCVCVKLCVCVCARVFSCMYEDGRRPEDFYRYVHM